jgi:hypothetical protein
VDKAHQLAGGPRAYANDAARVAFLFTLYQRITSLLPSGGRGGQCRAHRLLRAAAGVRIR